MRGPRASTGARWKTCKKALSTAISLKSADAIWCPGVRAGAPSLDVASYLCLAVLVAACGGDNGVLCAADGAIGRHGRRGPAGARRLSRDSRGAALPRDPDQHRPAGGG